MPEVIYYKDSSQIKREEKEVINRDVLRQIIASTQKMSEKVTRIEYRVEDGTPLQTIVIGTATEIAQALKSRGNDNSIFVDNYVNSSSDSDRKFYSHFDESGKVVFISPLI